MVSAAKDTHTVNRVVRIPNGLWDVFGEVAGELGMSRAAAVIADMQRLVNKHGTEDQINRMNAAMEDMAERRARKGGRPRKQPSE